MNYSIIYSSNTGNTKQLANVIKTALSAGNCCYFGEPDPIALESDMIFVGFWTDKGNCDKKTKTFLEAAKDKTIFLFGTAGFGGSETYYKEILTRIKQILPATCTLAGTFMCQGRMPLSVRQRYEKQLLKNPEDVKTQNFIANFDDAASHPDQNDCLQLKQAIEQVYTI